jgi:hypothetical protein
MTFGFFRLKRIKDSFRIRATRKAVLFAAYG